MALQVAGGMVYAHKVRDPSIKFWLYVHGLIGTNLAILGFLYAKLFHPDKNPTKLNVVWKFQVLHSPLLYCVVCSTPVPSDSGVPSDKMCYICRVDAV